MSLGSATGGNICGVRGYFCATVGAVTEKQIQDYIENQTDEDGTFEVWDESGEGDEDQSDDGD
jgi:hypothetical protein